MEIEAEPERGWNSPETRSRSYHSSASISFRRESLANNLYLGSKSNQREKPLPRTLPGADKPFYMLMPLNGSTAQPGIQSLPLDDGDARFQLNKKA